MDLLPATGDEMNRYDHPPRPDSQGYPVASESSVDDDIAELFPEEFSAEDWDASHLPSFTT
jgi:hypothetical protein